MNAVAGSGSRFTGRTGLEAGGRHSERVGQLADGGELEWKACFPAVDGHDANASPLRELQLPQGCSGAPVAQGRDRDRRRAWCHSETTMVDRWYTFRAATTHVELPSIYQLLTSDQVIYSEPNEGV